MHGVELLSLTFCISDYLNIIYPPIYGNIFLLVENTICNLVIRHIYRLNYIVNILCNNIDREVQSQHRGIILITGNMHTHYK